MWEVGAKPLTKNRKTSQNSYKRGSDKYSCDHHIYRSPVGHNYRKDMLFVSVAVVFQVEREAAEQLIVVFLCRELFQVFKPFRPENLRRRSDWIEEPLVEKPSENQIAAH